MLYYRQVGQFTHQKHGIDSKYLNRLEMQNVWRSGDGTYVPVPFPRVKSPPWHMKSGITRWKADPLKCRGFPDLPVPFSPVQRHRKFSAVRGTTSARSWPDRWDEGGVGGANGRGTQGRVS